MTMTLIDFFFVALYSHVEGYEYKKDQHSHIPTICLSNRSLVNIYIINTIFVQNLRSLLLIDFNDQNIEKIFHFCAFHTNKYCAVLRK